MKKLIFTTYMLLLFIFAARAHPHHVQKKPVDRAVVVVSTVDRVAVAKRKVQVRQHKRIHRRDVRAVRRHASRHQRHHTSCRK